MDTMSIDTMPIDEELEELSSAEDFLNFFEIDFDPHIVHVNRLHILQRFHDYLEQSQHCMPEGNDAKRAVYRALLQRAYNDFVNSDALTEKVFKVFRMNEPQQTFVPVDELLK